MYGTAKRKEGRNEKIKRIFALTMAVALLISALGFAEEYVAYVEEQVTEAAHMPESMPAPTSESANAPDPESAVEPVDTLEDERIWYLRI